VFSKTLAQTRQPSLLYATKWRLAMATNLDEIQAILNGKGIKNERHDSHGYVLVGVATEVYTASNGENSFFIDVEAIEGGRLVKVIAPALYQNNHTEHELAVLKTCMQITMVVKMVQCLYDEEDGEVRMAIDIPLADNSLAPGQLMRAIACIADAVDTFDECFHLAIAAGKVTVAPVIDRRMEQIKKAQLIQSSPEGSIEEVLSALGFSDTEPVNSRQKHVLH